MKLHLYKTNIVIYIKYIKNLFLTLLLLALSYGGFTQVTWEGDVSSDWNDPNNWAGDRLPRNGDDIEIDPTVFNYTFAPVISSNSVFIPKKLDVNNGGTLTIEANLTTTDRIRIDGNNTTTPTINMTAGVLTILNDKKLEIRDGGVMNFSGGTMNIEGDLNVDGGTFNMSENSGVSILNVDSDGNGKGKLIIKPRNGDNGLFSMSAGTATIGEMIELNGKGQGGSTNATIDISGGNFINNGPTVIRDTETDSTLFNVSGGNVTLVGDVADDPGKGGKISMNVSGGNLTFQGNLTMEQGDKITQTGGNIQFEGGNKTWTNDGTFNSTGGTVTFNDPVNTQLVEAGAGGTWNFNNVVINNGMTMTQTTPANINIAGNWTNNGGNFNENGKSVTFNGAALQTITNAGGETFFDLIVNNSRSGISLANNVLATNSLTMSQGNINAGVNRLTLGTSTANVGTFNYSSGRVIGEFERWINGASTGVDISFATGTTANNRPATVNFTNLTGGSLIIEFIPTDPGANGLPLSESGYNITNQFTEGYWAITAANGLTSTDYNLTLKGGGFTSYGIGPLTRIVKRANGGSPWTLDGIHVAGSQLDTTAARNNINGITAQFGFAVTDCLFPPTSVINGADSVCKSSSHTYFVNYNNPNTYAWTLFGGGSFNPVPGPNDTSVNVDWGTVGGDYLIRLSESVACGNMWIVQDTIRVHPYPTGLIVGNTSVCPNSTESYSVTNNPGYSYQWIITGGTQTSGTTTNAITVNWGNGSTGKVDVIATSACGAADTSSLNVTLDGYFSSTVTQTNNNPISQYTFDAEMIGIEIIVNSNCSDTVKQFNFNTRGGNSTGSTNPPANISVAKVYYTGTLNTFSTTTLFGSINTPNGAFSITGSQALTKGTHYFWLSYDVPITAIVNDTLDARLDSLLYLSTWKKDMTVSKPAGYRLINASTAYYSRFNGNWNTNNIWSNTDNGASCGCEPNGNGIVFIDTGHVIQANRNRIVDHIMIQDGALLNGAGGRLDVNGTLRTEGTGAFTLDNRLTVLGNTTLRGTGVSSSSNRMTFEGNLDVGAGVVLTETRNQDIRIRGSLIVDGILENLGNRDFRVDGNNPTSISGSGTLIATNPASEFQVRKANRTILAGTNLTIQPFFRIRDPLTITNYGTVTLQGTGLNTQGDLDGNSAGSIWTNGANSTLNYGGASDIFATAGVLNASASGNTINYNRNGNQTVVLPSGNQYYHLSLSTGGRKTLAGAVDINGNVSVNTGATFVTANNNIAIAGNWINDGSFISGTNTVTFDGVSTVSGVSTTVFNNITTTGSLTGHAVQMDLTGNWLNNGSYNHNNGLLSFTGTGAQTITGGTTFGSMTINNAAGVSVAGGNQQLAKTLTLTSGNFSTNNTFTILSDSSGSTGNIATITGGTITGNITMQRYISGTTAGWRMLSSAVSNATFSHWDNFGIVTGYGFLITGLQGSAYPAWAPYTYYYDESVLDIKDSGYVAPINITDPIVVGKGYFNYIFAADLPTTIEVTGPPNTGNFSFNVSYSSTASQGDDGWNMVGNTYPSALNWDAPVGWTRTNIDSSYYIWNRALGQYGSYILGGPGTNGATGFIPSSQAFWVKANAAAPVFGYAETVKSNQNPVFAQKRDNTTCMLRFNLSGSGYKDESIVRFIKKATSDFDKGHDAYKLTTFDFGPPSLSTLGTDSSYLSINSYPALSQDVSIPLDVTVQIDGNYTISLGEVDNLPLSTWVLLEDLDSSTITNLKVDSSYTFYTTVVPANNSPRFMLHFNAPLSLDIDNVSCNGKSDGKAIIEKKGTGPWDFIWTNSTGDTIKTSNNINGPDSLTGLNTGSYSVYVKDGSSNVYEDTFSISELPLLVSSFTTDVDTTYLSEGGFVQFYNNSQNASSYEWDFDDGTPHSTDFESKHQYTKAGTYLISLLASNGTCIDTTFKLISVLSKNPSGINNIGLSAENSVNVYQSDGAIIVEINFSENENYTLDMYNVIGQKFFHTSNVETSERVIKIKMPNDGEGVYFVHFETANYKIAKKITFIK